MFEENAADRSVLFTPTNVVELIPEFLLEQGSTFASEPVDDWAGARAVIVVELGALEIAVVVEELEAAEATLREVAQQSSELARTNVPMLINHPNGYAIPFHNLHSRNCGGTLKAR
jgi:hypothetical protein